MITVIETSTDERMEETSDLFGRIKPLLDAGYSYMGALVEIGEVEPSNRHGVYNRGWFMDLKRYGAEHGYPYHKYRWRK